MSELEIQSFEDYLYKKFGANHTSSDVSKAMSGWLTYLKGVGVKELSTNGMTVKI